MLFHAAKILLVLLHNYYYCYCYFCYYNHHYYYVFSYYYDYFYRYHCYHCFYHCYAQYACSGWLKSTVEAPEKLVYRRLSIVRPWLLPSAPRITRR